MIQTDISSISYVGNGSTATPYTVPFYFFTNQDIVVVVRDNNDVETVQTLNTDYTVTGAGNVSGGEILTTWAVPSSSRVSISRVIEATQLTSYEEADAFPAKSHERALDKLTMLVQQALRGAGGGPTDVGHIFRLTESSAGITPVSQVNDTTLGIDAMGHAVLRTTEEMVGWLGTIGTVWLNDAERANTAGAYAGQMGVQKDNKTIYIANSTSPGDWVPFLLGTGVVAATTGTPELMARPAGALVGTTEPQNLSNKTFSSPVINSPTGITKADVGLGNVDNTSDINKPVSLPTQAALDLRQLVSQKGISNGYPSLDSSGKVPTLQLPDSVVGASQYQGTWNAATNTPAIPAAAIGNKGWYYSVAVAGSTSINGVTPWAVGDDIISSGTVWQKIPNVSAVISVNTKTGAVVLDKTDIGLNNVDNTSDATKNSASATLTNKTINGANNTLTVRLDADVTNNLPVSRLNGGTGAGAATAWFGDGTWKTPTGTGDVAGPAASVTDEIVLYSGTTGKVIKRATGTGIVNVTNGVYQTPISAQGLSPAGTVVDYAGTTEPAGWLFCDGRQVSQATYAGLYSAIGTSFNKTLYPRMVADKSIGFYPNSANTTTFTLSSVPVTGNNRLLIVWVAIWEGATSPTITSLTFNGVAMTALTNVPLYYASGVFRVWYMVNPPAVTANVVLTISNTSPWADSVNILAQVYNDVNQSTPVGTAATNYTFGSSSAELDVQVPSLPGELVVAGSTTYMVGTELYLSNGAWELSRSDPFAPTGNYDFILVQAYQQTDFRETTTEVASVTKRMMRGQSNSVMLQPFSIIGFTIKPVAVAGGNFCLPDLRGRVIAGRDNLGGAASGRIAPVVCSGTTLGSGPGNEYLYYISYFYSWEGYPQNNIIQAGMRVTGPGIAADTFVIGWWNGYTLYLNKPTTGTNYNGRYTFSWADTTAMGATIGSSNHTLTYVELAGHVHQWTGIAGTGGSGVPGGAGYAFTNNKTLSVGTLQSPITSQGNTDMPHNQFQPTMLMNKIIKT